MYKTSNGDESGYVLCPPMPRNMIRRIREHSHEVPRTDRQIQFPSILRLEVVDHDRYNAVHSLHIFIISTRTHENEEKWEGRTFWMTLKLYESSLPSTLLPINVNTGITFTNTLSGANRAKPPNKSSA